MNTFWRTRLVMFIALIAYPAALAVGSFVFLDPRGEFSHMLGVSAITSLVNAGLFHIALKRDGVANV